MVGDQFRPHFWKGMGFCFIQIDEYWERFETKGGVKT